jgi:hypothetical protein
VVKYESSMNQLCVKYDTSLLQVCYMGGQLGLKCASRIPQVYFNYASSIIQISFKYALINAARMLRLTNLVSNILPVDFKNNSNRLGVLSFH